MEPGSMKESSFSGQASQLTRRNFLTLSGMSLFALVWPRMRSKFQASLFEQEGRVCTGSAKVYQLPSFSSNEVREIWKDTILPITYVTIGDKEPEYNRVWYRIGSEGYVHSGSIQPVQTTLNEPQAAIPETGILAEVTMPFTDAHSHPGNEFAVIYRYYFETTHWVDKLVQDHAGGLWYRVREDRWDYIYYVPAEHLRIIPADELNPRSPFVPDAAKRIEVNLAAQIVIAYEWNKPVFMTKAATGAKFSNGNFSTPLGRHLTFHKRPSRHMAAGNLAANGYDLPGVPWVSYFTEKGVAFHGTYWHNDFGRPRSHGCINLTSQAAKWLYLWTKPAVPPDEQRVYEDYGTQVDVFEGFPGDSP